MASGWKYQFGKKAKLLTCNVCNKPVDGDWVFCPACGSRLRMDHKIYKYMLKDDLIKTNGELSSIINLLQITPFQIEDWLIKPPHDQYIGSLEINTKYGQLFIASRLIGDYEIRMKQNCDKTQDYLINKSSVNFGELTELLSKNIKYIS